MWNCGLCRVSFAFESVEQHVYANHLKPGMGRIKVYNCGECTFVAEGFEDIALHCINLEHEPSRVNKGLGYEEYVFRLFTVLEEIICLSKPSALKTFGSEFLTTPDTPDKRGTPISYMLNWSRPTGGSKYEYNTGINQLSGADDNEPTPGLDAEDEVSSLYDAKNIELIPETFQVPKAPISTLNPKSMAKRPLLTNSGDSGSGTDLARLEGNMKPATADFASPVVSVGDEKKSYPCTYCPKISGTSSAAKVHQRVHTGEKPFQCQTCGQSFARKHVLRNHHRTHTGEKPFPCNICGKSFIQQQHLTIHHRTHTGEKPFSCSACFKSFAKSDNLKTHQRVHTGEKAFFCMFCRKGFSRSLRMKTHETTCSLNQ